MLEDIHLGDIVRVGDDTKPWRVEAKDHKTGMLTLESLHTMTRIVWEGVHEFKEIKAGAFA